MKRPFGRTVDGKEVEVFTLGSEPGLQAEILTLGGTLRSRRPKAPTDAN